MRVFLLEGGGGVRDIRFDPDRFARERPLLMQGFGYVAELHGRADNVEVWGPTPLASLIEDLRRLREWCAISEAQAATLYEALARLTTDLRAEARDGRKAGGGRLELYAHRDHGAPTDIVIDGGAGFQLVLHSLRRPYFTVSREAATAALFRRFFEERRAEAQALAAPPAYTYRSYTDQMTAATAVAAGQLKPAVGS